MTAFYCERKNEREQRVSPGWHKATVLFNISHSALVGFLSGDFLSGVMRSWFDHLFLLPEQWTW